MRDDLYAAGLKAPDWWVLQAIARRLAAITEPPENGKVQRIKDTGFASISTLAKDAGLHYRRTHQALRNLISAGFLHKSVEVPDRQVKRHRIAVERFDLYLPTDKPSFGAASAPTPAPKPTYSRPATATSSAKRFANPRIT
ncbi:hypothetical protein JAO29_18950 [Edaphobacter sp. HDX4]|uniref:hypothetical protein n=1 Tax=Edaphobacter sp. HDX4 TaxID=2794064 RepID=UPI002FE55831